VRSGQGGARRARLWSDEVDTLYGDALQFLYHLGLAILVGGGLVLGSAVAPAIFRTLPSRAEAGSVFGAVLARWDGLAIFCVILVVVTSVLKAGAYEVTGAPEARLIARWIFLVVMSAALVYSSGWANPVARSLRSQVREWDDEPESSPVRREFNGLHRRSSRAMRVALFAGAIALFLS
jgi:hypothetical protein